MTLSAKVDLHIHSTFSDGALRPAEIVDLAESLGLMAIAVTDHDTVGGIDEAMAQGGKKSIEVVSGIEISSWHGDTSMHILGYNFNHKDRDFNRRLRLLQQGRETRNVKIVANLNRLGIRTEIGELQQYSQYGQTGRPHIARLLVDKGAAKTVDLAFKHYLGRGAAAYAERFRFSAADAVAMIRDAGGMAVLAHPAILDPSLRTIPSLLKTLAGFGLEGVEAYYPSHSSKAVKALLKMAADLELQVTGGSDFHDTERSGYNFRDWQSKTQVPYEIIAIMKNNRRDHHAGTASRHGQ